MSSYRETRRKEPTRPNVGEQLRQLRVARELPQWKVAPEAHIDSSLLSKIENGERIATEEQLAALAKYFRVPLAPLEAQRLAEAMRERFGDSPVFAAATALLNEEAGEYPVKRRPTAVSKRPSRVNNARKRK